MRVLRMKSICEYFCAFRLGIALRHEEKRCGFLTDEIKIMVSTHDEIAGRYVKQKFLVLSSFFLSRLSHLLRRMLLDLKVKVTATNRRMSRFFKGARWHVA